MPRRRERSVVESALVACRGPFMAIGVFSGAINILTLSGSLYMLQIYDRVLSSGSVPTLVGLSLLLLAAYALQGALDAIRVRMLSRIGAQFDDAVSAPAFAALQRLPLIGARADLAAQPLRDLDQIRGFLSSLGPTAFFDLPWMPLFFLGCFLLHPWLGVLALAGGILIVGLTIMTEIRSRAAIKAINESVAERQTIIEASRRNAEVLLAMGMEPAFQRRWRIINSRHIKHWLAGSDATSGIGSFAKIFRMVLQSAVLGLGAYLSIRGSITGGAMIAASILTSRALAPIEIAVAHWKGFVAARDGLKRLRSTLEGPLFNVPQRTALPAPKNELTVAGLVVGAPGRQSAIVQGVSFRLQAGHGLGVIGATASGKSTLARALVGAWRPLKGDVRLDGAALDQWPAGALGLHVGYLPQDIELFEGTVAENIARFQPDASDEAIVAAARAANAHDLIVRLENGYETRIGEAGAALSGGQRQRVGLARALFGNPFLVVLDEPNSNLDAEGDEALVRAVAGIRKRGGIVVLITHRLRALTAVDQVAIMAGGQIQQMQSSEEFLKKAMQPQPVPTQPPQRTALS